MIDYDKFSKEVKGYRVKVMNGHSYKVSLRNTALRIGISSTTLTRVENGGTCDLETFARVCVFLGVSMDRYIKK